jgi:ribonuclease HI
MKIEKAVLYTDGASRGNPGPAAIGAVIKDGQGSVLSRISRRIGRTTNNQAEYRAIIAALEEAIRLGVARVELKSDSELAVHQINGRYRVKNPGLRPLHQQVRELQSRFQSFSIAAIPRRQNAAADRLSNDALDRVVD